MNTFTTKRKLAELYYGAGEIDYCVLAKLLVLQKLNPSLFIELNEWNKRFSILNEEYRQMRDALSEGGDTSVTEDKYKAWRIPSIVKWVESEPVELEKIRLDRSDICFIVWWKGQDDPEESAIILPNLYLIKESDNEHDSNQKD